MKPNRPRPSDRFARPAAPRPFRPGGSRGEKPPARPSRPAGFQLRRPESARPKEDAPAFRPSMFPGPRSQSAKPEPVRGAVHGLARILSKQGFCSRSEAVRLIQAGRVTLNDRVCRNPDQPTNFERDRIEVDTMPITARPKVYLMLNKPRGLVTTTSDEQGRSTVFTCLPTGRPTEADEGDPARRTFGKGPNVPDKITLPEKLSPVGRLDQASEGLLLFTNDTEWADLVTAPASHVEKTYHVQINRVADAALCQRLKAGVEVEGETLGVKRVSILRGGDKNSWLEITLDEGRNRQIRRILGGCGIDVLRLIRVAVGSLQLGQLAKGQWRHLTLREIALLRAPDLRKPSEE